MAHATEEEVLGDSSESSLEWRSLSQGHLQGNVASSAAPSMLMMHGAQPMRKEVRVCPCAGHARTWWVEHLTVL